MRKKPELTHVITFRVTEKQHDLLTMYAEKSGIPLSRLVNNLISVGLDDLALLNHMGVVGMIGNYRKLKEKLYELHHGEMLPF